jgi:hypothetical protein
MVVSGDRICAHTPERVGAMLIAAPRESIRFQRWHAPKKPDRLMGVQGPVRQELNTTPRVIP